MSEIQSGGAEMSSVAEASALLRRVAGPRGAGDSVKALIRRTARRLQWGPSRVKDVWYQDARRIEAYEMDRLRAEAARADIENAVRSVVGLRERLAATDPDFHKPTIDALDSALRAMGADVCPGAIQKAGRKVKR